MLMPGLRGPGRLHSTTAKTRAGLDRKQPRAPVAMIGLAARKDRPSCAILERFDVANEQHELMLAAMRARDGAAVSLAVRNDIEAAYRVLASLLGAEIAQ